MTKHDNLFHYLESKPEVYRKLQEDYQRDQKQAGWFRISGSALIPLAIGINDSHVREILFFAGGYCFLTYALIFIDLSNRNFLMHAIDWYQAKDEVVPQRVADRKEWLAEHTEGRA